MRGRRRWNDSCLVITSGVHEEKEGNDACRSNASRRKGRDEENATRKWRRISVSHFIVIIILPFPAFYFFSCRNFPLSLFDVNIIATLEVINFKSLLTPFCSSLLPLFCSSPLDVTLSWTKWEKNSRSEVGFTSFLFYEDKSKEHSFRDSML